MANSITRLHTWFYGEKVGEDSDGNIYYQQKKPPKSGRRRRWVIYKNLVEASLIPPLYHGWLHYTIDDFPHKSTEQDWQIPHRANMSGTNMKYIPTRQKATGDYSAWTPNNS